MAELAKQSLTAATAAVKEAATAGAAAIAASSIATQEESAPPDETRPPAETANEPMTTESDKILSPRKEAGALVRLGEAEKAAKIDYAEALRRLKKAREEYTGANTKINQKQTTIGKFLALNSKLIDRQSTKTNSPMKSERLDVVLSETGEATGLVGYAAFAEMKSLMAEGEVWNGGYDVAGKPVLIKIEIGWAYWGARHKYCSPLEHLTRRTQTEIKHNPSLTHKIMENSTPPITTCQSQTNHKTIQALPNNTTHTNLRATTLQVLSGGLPVDGKPMLVEEDHGASTRPHGVSDPCGKKKSEKSMNKQRRGARGGSSFGRGVPIPQQPAFGTGPAGLGRGSGPPIRPSTLGPNRQTSEGEDEEMGMPTETPRGTLPQM